MIIPVLSFVSLVEGESCPAPVDVEARVRTILHLAADQELTEGFAVERHEAGLYVALHSADSTLIGERTLPTEGSCDELAQAAAVVLAAWLTDVHPDFAGALPPPPPEPEPEPTAAPEPPPPPALAPPPAAPSPPPRRLPPPQHRFHLVGAVGADLAGSSLTPALLLGASFGSEPRGWGISVRALATLPRDEPLGPGQVAWSRWPLELGPTLRLSSANLAFAVSGGISAAWLRLGGDSFDEVSDQSAVSWGGFAEVLVSDRRTPLGLMGALNAQFYPGNTEAYVSGLNQKWPLPPLSLTLVVGGRLAP